MKDQSVPKRNTKIIYDCAFSQYYILKRVTISGSVIHIGKDAFYGCGRPMISPLIIMYQGTAAQWKAIEKEKGNDRYIVHCIDGNIVENRHLI